MSADKYFKFLIPCLLMFFGNCAFVNMTLVQPVTPLKEHVIEGKGRPKILLIDISGVISEQEEEESLGLRKRPSLVAQIKEALQKAEMDEDISGVIIKINSPGGTVSASDIIHHELIKFKEKKNIPLYACIMGIGTSGGYYIASAADEIIAHPNAITGSIGVIAMNFNIEGLLTKIGVEEASIKSGDKKDMFSPFRTSTSEEDAIMQAIIDNLHDKFVRAVYENRKHSLSEEEVRLLADGRIYTADQALSSKLIDRIEYLDDTIKGIKQNLGIEQARIVTYYRGVEYPGTIYSAYPAGNSSFAGLLNNYSDSTSPFSGIKFMYLWKP